ncbi:Protein ABHD11 [Trichoplax sp. H2]|nr:Protein ABHD11 [Trichoplax sp. H2]|eukprot:RDD46513.1 Protein ABHD11 [Trichoplax sp. H2]
MARYLRRAMCTYDYSKFRSVDLAYSVYENFRRKEAVVAPAIIILHALFSNRLTWNHVARALSKATKRKVITLDARNHGDSPHVDDMSQFSMVDDIKCIVHKLQLRPPVVILGHSVGGRTGMTMALNGGLAWVKSLIVVDESPSMNPILLEESPTQLYIDTLKNVNPNRFNNLQEIDHALADTIKSKGSRHFLLQNIYEKHGKFNWKFNIESIANNLSNIRDVPRRKGEQYSGNTLFIGGSNSNHIRVENYAEIGELFPNALIHHVEGTGHWIHAQNPTEFINITSNFLIEDER